MLANRDLFEYQAIPQVSWVMPEVAGCAVWPGITSPMCLGVAGRRWPLAAS